MLAMGKLMPAVTPDQILGMSWAYVMCVLEEAVKAHASAVGESGGMPSGARRGKLPPAEKMMSSDGIHQHAGWYSQLVGLLKRT
jgi:hypothetical protein